VSAFIRNALSSFVLTQQISVMSNVSGLFVELKYAPVIFLRHSTKNFGRAFFQFHYLMNTFAASHAMVSFDIGDNKTSKFGPFWLGMDYLQNISKTPFFYDYNTIGDYNVTFTVWNAISFKILYQTVNVVEAIYGVYIQIQPSNGYPGMSFMLQAFVKEGNNVTLEWFIDGFSFGSNPRLCMCF
jgi:hypothetical protein